MEGSALGNPTAGISTVCVCRVRGSLTEKNIFLNRCTLGDHVSEIYVFIGSVLNEIFGTVVLISRSN